MSGKSSDILRVFWLADIGVAVFLLILMFLVDLNGDYPFLSSAASRATTVLTMTFGISINAFLLARDPRHPRKWIALGLLIFSLSMLGPVIIGLF